MIGLIVKLLFFILAAVVLIAVYNDIVAFLGDLFGSLPSLPWGGA